MKFGHFDDENREYIITDPKTPTRWINYIGTLRFGGFVDQTGGALICKGDPALNRITKYIPHLPGSSFNGEGLYVRIKGEEEYFVFSPFYTPILIELDRFEAHVGLGYTSFISELSGLRCEVTVFVPIDEEIELRDIRITNIGSEALEVDAIPVVEYTHPDALKQFTNADWIPQTMVSRAFEDEEGQIILKQYPFMLRDARQNFFTSNHPASSFETDRAVFLGGNGYGSFQLPGSLLRPELSNSEANRGDNLAVLLHHFGKLLPGESRRLITQLGQTEKVKELPEIVKKYRDPLEVDQAFQELNRFWVGYLAKVQVSTPNADMDQMLNIHNPRQCLITKNWSRYLSLYQLGLGDRGIGFRDSSQDVLGVMSFIPEEAVDLVRNLLSVQKRDGSAMHQYNPMTMIGSTGEANQESNRFYSDDHLWAVLSVTAYLKETGQMEFLDEVIPFYEKDDAHQPLENGTVLEHLIRGIEFTRKMTGVHGLPLLGFADWNDTVNLRPGAESVFTACLFGMALRELIELAEFLGEETLAERWSDDFRSMKEKVNQEAWDGAWYCRYLDADGNPIGSSKNDHGKIFTNAQSWSVLAGYADQNRGRQALDSVKEFLDTDYGIKLSTPGYDGFDPLIGGVSTYPPGAKENGGIFLHANPWVIIAETILGDGDQAFAYYNKINPVAKNDMMEIYESEPYAYPQNILGNEHPQFGLARNSWLTGTASWVYLAATRYILGIRPEYNGLRISPRIPSDWPGFTARRELRSAIYDIEVKRDPSIPKDRIKLVIDGDDHSGELVPYFDDGKSHRIAVFIHERSN
jgi:cellobiose phosphorylase